MENLHVFLFPFMGQGHMIPILDIAKLFSYRGVRSTIITTPLNSHFFTRSIPESGKLSSQSRIDVLTIRSQLYSQTVTDILKIGAGVGALQRENREEGVGVRKEEIVKAVETVMVGEEAEEIRNRAKELKTKAKTAIEEGGSSHSDLNALIHELSSHSL